MTVLLLLVRKTGRFERLRRSKSGLGSASPAFAGRTRSCFATDGFQANEPMTLCNLEVRRIMKVAAKIRNFVVAGHGGSGKTSLSELMLYKAGAIARPGSVESKTTVSDFMPDEQEKLSSIYSAAMNCVWKEHHFFFMDTPGYGEFVGEPLSAMAAADNALIVLDGVDGPLMGTARGWKFSRLRGIPRFGLINRLDRERADFRRVLEQMRKNHGRTVVIPLTCPVGSESGFSRVVNVLFDKDIPPEIADDVAEYRELLMDAIAETDENLMERYLGGETIADDEIMAGLKMAVLSCRIIPVFAGSVAKDIGITELMDNIIAIFADPLAKKTITLADGETMPVSEDGPGVAQIFKAINDPFIGQLTLFKVQSGSFRADSEVFNVSTGQKERFGNLLLLNGKSQTVVPEIGPGVIAAVAKLKAPHVSDTLATDAAVKPLPVIEFPHATMSYAITAAKSGEDEKIAAALYKIAECDPTVRVYRDEETHELLLSGMGDLHLHNVARKLKDMYKVEAVLNTPKIPYRETITASGEGHYRHKKQTGGSGQFGDVWVRFEPQYESDEMVFAEEVFGGSVPKNFFPAVEKGLREAANKGVLAGYPLVGLKATLYDGSYHPVDSNEMAFKTAAQLAYKEGIANASPTILEPIGALQVTIPDSYLGDVMGDLNKRRGRVMGMNPTDDGNQILEAEVPMAEMTSYAIDLRSLTQSRGSFTFHFVRYEEAPPAAQQKAIADAKAIQEEG